MAFCITPWPYTTSVDIDHDFYGLHDAWQVYITICHVLYSLLFKKKVVNLSHRKLVGIAQQRICMII